jgi:esterase/lipase
MTKNVLILTFFILSLITSCKLKVNTPSRAEEDNTTSETTPTAPTAFINPDQFTSSVLSNESYPYSGSTRSYQLLEAQSGSKNPTYMQWIPNETNTSSGAVIIYYPYESINWTGLAIDSKWYNLSSGGHPDEDGPYYNPLTSSSIYISPMTHLTAAQSNSIFMINKLHTLIVYGRFYSGSTVADDVQTIVDAYRFLNTKDVVDKTKIGIHSGSWGGVGVLFGTKAAEAYSLKPKTISIAYPVSDLKALLAYIDSIPTLTSDLTKQSEYAAFFDPYQRRLNKATEALAGQSSRYDKYSSSELASIDSSIFVIHDDWDTLVPSSLTNNLLNTMTGADKYVYYQRHSSALNYTTAILSHSQTLQPIDLTTVLTWNYLFLITELTDPSLLRVTIFSLNSFVAQFQHMKAMFDAGQDTTLFRKSLALLCRPNFFMNDSDSGTTYSGSDVLVFMMNNYYLIGWAADGPSSCAKLLTTPPF